MLSEYSNYNSDDFIAGSATVTRGGLNPYQEFRPLPQKLGTNMGITSVMVNLVTDTPGILYIEFTNTVREPYDFSSQYTITGTIGVKQKFSYSERIKATYLRVRFANTSDTKQTVLKLNTLLSGADLSGISESTGMPINTDASGNLIASVYSGSNSIGYKNLDPDGKALLIYVGKEYTETELSVTYDTDSTTTDVYDLTRYKNFDVLLQVTANQASTLTFNIYAANNIIYSGSGTTVFHKTSYSIDINPGDTSVSFTNITLNARYFRLEGPFDADFTIDKCTVCCYG